MQYRILKTFMGSQDGRFAEEFIAGTDRELSRSLATVALKEGWAVEAGPAADGAAPVARSVRRKRASP